MRVDKPTVSDQLLLDIGEHLTEHTDLQILTEWQSVLEKLPVQYPEMELHRKLLSAFSERLEEHTAEELAHLEPMVTGCLEEIALLMLLCTGLSLEAMAKLQPLFAAHEPMKEQIAQELVRLWKLDFESRMHLERTALKRYLGPMASGGVE
ncbi:MAG: hypothetical protein U0931_04270 [Vulcanimicrobiota bacterium]